MNRQWLRRKLVTLLAQRNPWFGGDVTYVDIFVKQRLSIKDCRQRYTKPLTRALASMGLSTFVDDGVSEGDDLEDVENGHCIQVYLRSNHLFLAILPWGHFVARAAALWCLRTTLRALGVPAGTYLVWQVRTKTEIRSIQHTLRPDGRWDRVLSSEVVQPDCEVEMLC